MSELMKNAGWRELEKRVSFREEIVQGTIEFEIEGKYTKEERATQPEGEEDNTETFFCYWKKKKYNGVVRTINRRREWKKMKKGGKIVYVNRMRWNRRKG